MDDLGLEGREKSGKDAEHRAPPRKVSVSANMSALREGVVSSSHDPRRTAIIVEERSELRNALRAALAGIDYTVHFVSDFDECGATIDALQPSLVIVDAISENELKKHLRHAVPKTHRAIPILVLSGKMTVEAKRVAVAAGADGFLVVPFQRDSLKAMVNAMLIRHRQTAPLAEEDPFAATFDAMAAELEPVATRLVRKFSGRHAGGGTDQMQCVDDVLLAVWKNMPAHLRFDDNARLFVWEMPKVETVAWLAGISANICSAAARADRRRTSRIGDVDSLLAASITPRYLEDLEQHEFLERLLMSLADRDREVIVERYLDDLPLATIAEKHGLSQGTVKNICSASLKLMRSLRP